MRCTSLTVLAIGILAIGCADHRLMQLSDDARWLTAPMGPGIIPREDSPIPDLPMPIGFVVLADQSRVEIVGDQRYVLHVYQGQSPFAEVLRFYRQQTARNDWRPIGEDGKPPRQLLWYEKGPEQLSIQLDRVGNIVTATVFITYIGPGATPPAWAMGSPTSDDSDWK